MSMCLKGSELHPGLGMSKSRTPAVMLLQCMKVTSAQGISKMQVLCHSNDESVEIRCSDCGQGFALYWGRQTDSEKAEALEGMVRALKQHRCTAPGPQGQAAHPFLAHA